MTSLQKKKKPFGTLIFKSEWYQMLICLFFYIYIADDHFEGVLVI